MMIILNISIVQINIIIYYQMPYTIEHEWILKIKIHVVENIQPISY